MEDPDIEDELRQILQDRSSALVEGDVGYFQRLLADDFSYTNASGKSFDKQGYIALYIESGQMQWQAQEVDELEIRSVGEAAVVTCRIHDRAVYHGQAFEGLFRSMQVFVKRSVGWQYLVGQTTTMEPKNS